VQEPSFCILSVVDPEILFCPAGGEGLIGTGLKCFLSSSC